HLIQETYTRGAGLQPSGRRWMKAFLNLNNNIRPRACLIRQKLDFNITAFDVALVVDYGWGIHTFKLC
ncbi:MAG: hypothetical protein PVG34_15060, partial [Desulfobacterales bacterium]